MIILAKRVSTGYNNYCVLLGYNERYYSTHYKGKSFKGKSLFIISSYSDFQIDHGWYPSWCVTFANIF